MGEKIYTRQEIVRIPDYTSLRDCSDTYYGYYKLFQEFENKLRYDTQKAVFDLFELVPEDIVEKNTDYEKAKNSLGMRFPLEFGFSYTNSNEEINPFNDFYDFGEKAGDEWKKNKTEVIKFLKENDLKIVDENDINHLNYLANKILKKQLKEATSIIPDLPPRLYSFDDYLKKEKNSFLYNFISAKKPLMQVTVENEAKSLGHKPGQWIGERFEQRKWNITLSSEFKNEGQDEYKIPIVKYLLIKMEIDEYSVYSASTQKTINKEIVAVPLV